LNPPEILKPIFGHHIPIGIRYSLDHGDIGDIFILKMIYKLDIIVPKRFITKTLGSIEFLL
jgi:hypothetical protein